MKNISLKRTLSVLLAMLMLGAVMPSAPAAAEEQNHLPAETPIPEGEMINRYAITNKNVRFREDKSTKSKKLKDLRAYEYVYALRSEINDRGEDWTAVIYENTLGYVMSEFLTVLSQEDSDIVMAGGTPVPPITAAELDEMERQPRESPAAISEVTPEPTPEPEQFIGYGITLGNTVYVRNWPDPGSIIIDQLPAGKIVAVEGQAYQDGVAWHHIQYDQKEGYVRADMIRLMTQNEAREYPGIQNATAEPAVQMTVAPYEDNDLSSYGYTLTTVNFREKPSRNSARIRQLKKFALCLVLGKVDTDGDVWYQVMYEGKTGYIMDPYFKQMTKAELEAFLVSADYQQGIANNAAGSGSGSSSSYGANSENNRENGNGTDPDTGNAESFAPFDPFVTAVPQVTENPDPYANSVAGAARADGIDFSGCSDEELYSIIASARNELTKRAGRTGGNTVIYQEDGITLYLTGKYTEADWVGEIGIECVIVNETDQAFYVNETSIYVNGWAATANRKTIETLAPGKKAKGFILFKAEKADVESFKDVEDIELTIELINPDTYKTIKTIKGIKAVF